jgi:hypothetical protein
VEVINQVHVRKSIQVSQSFPKIDALKYGSP